MASPLNILEQLYPCLCDCARFADLLQHRIEAVADKEDATNIFAAALSDADISIQAAVEVSILSRFPEIPFFGEEWKSSRNTKYLSGTTFVTDVPYLITLDPVDGTRIYLDRKKLYQIICTVISREAIESVLVLYPAYGDFVYAVKGGGAFRGQIGDAIKDAKSLKLQKGSDTVYLGSEFHHGKEDMKREYKNVYCSVDYNETDHMPYLSSALRNELSGAIFTHAQIIDGAALAFVAKEMGYIVQTFEGKPMPRPEDYPALVFPGLIVAEDRRGIERLRNIARRYN